MKQSIWWQHLLPQQTLSSLAGKAATCQTAWFKNWAIKTFIQHYQVELSEAVIENYRNYETFNAFFTRQLKKEARPIANGANTIVSPVDGEISAVGTLTQDQILQAKGKYFSIASLLQDATLAAQFESGSFLTAYLAPKDYHRFHMPIGGRLREMRYIPGKLFSVNQKSVAGIERLFARNERVVAVFDTEIGPFAYVAVGAMVVGSIGMVWHGIVNAQHTGRPCVWSYAERNIEIARGQECGFFQLGSTVLLFFPPNAIAWDNALQAGTSIKMGCALGQMIR